MYTDNSITAVHSTLEPSTSNAWLIQPNQTTLNKTTSTGLQPFISYIFGGAAGCKIVTGRFITEYDEKQEWMSTNIHISLVNCLCL